MKKLILSVAMVFATASAFSQTPSSPDLSNSPSGVGFGGALGGGNSTTAPTNIPSNTQPRGNDFGSTTILDDQQRIQEQQETMDPNDTTTNPMGGGLGGGAIDNTTPSNMDTTIPRGTAPSTTTPAAPASGVGTGVPSSY